MGDGITAPNCPFVPPSRSYTNPRASLQDDSAPTSPREVRWVLGHAAGEHQP